MSASLVGSEMCIRDSGTLQPGLQIPWTRDGELPNLASAALRVEEAKPVSYTHLTLPTICSV
eukprot:13152603-Alexandrium_andersonii.AAC.1